MHAIRNNFDASQFDAYVDGMVAGSLQYRIQDGQMWLLDMDVDRNYRSRKLKDGLVRNALVEAHRRRLSVLPFCPETRQHVFSHPVFMRLVPEAERARFSKSLTRTRKAGKR
ncbi:GNAT family N-acetyltransferase [Arthrobacter mobilis]|uniref:N-acetyltransferase n=1 Tax=Arthrobacter mobilis TaxID=2724944 RepID=A0A7X6K4C3_9MICC|nr:N-acetyltransferase [Arthrobacter mobilis]NKX53064.1 N-acetyltransferase [Arthrobacter mobilis]